VGQQSRDPRHTDRHTYRHTYTQTYWSDSHSSRQWLIRAIIIVTNANSDSCLRISHINQSVTLTCQSTSIMHYQFKTLKFMSSE